MLVTSTPPTPAAARVSSSAVRFALSTALPIHHQRVHGLASEVVAGHAKFADCPTATWARRNSGRSARVLTPCPPLLSGEGGHRVFPLSRRERGPGGEAPASKTARSRTTAPYPRASAPRGSPRRSSRRTPGRTEPP